MYNILRTLFELCELTSLNLVVFYCFFNLNKNTKIFSLIKSDLNVIKNFEISIIKENNQIKAFNMRKFKYLVTIAENSSFSIRLYLMLYKFYLYSVRALQFNVTKHDYIRNLIKLYQVRRIKCLN